MQSNKDSNGGKSHLTNKSPGKPQNSKSDEKKSAANSPVGTFKSGEKKTTPH